MLRLQAMQEQQRLANEAAYRNATLGLEKELNTERGRHNLASETLGTTKEEDTRDWRNQTMTQRAKNEEDRNKIEQGGLDIKREGLKLGQDRMNQQGDLARDRLDQQWYLEQQKLLRGQSPYSKIVQDPLSGKLKGVLPDGKYVEIPSENPEAPAPAAAAPQSGWNKITTVLKNLLTNPSQFGNSEPVVPQPPTPAAPAPAAVAHPTPPVPNAVAPSSPTNQPPVVTPAPAQPVMNNPPISNTQAQYPTATNGQGLTLIFKDGKWQPLPTQ